MIHTSTLLVLLLLLSSLVVLYPDILQRKKTMLEVYTDDVHQLRAIMRRTSSDLHQLLQLKPELHGSSETKRIFEDIESIRMVLYRDGRKFSMRSAKVIHDALLRSGSMAKPWNELVRQATTVQRPVGFGIV
jgi:hypothetical protein